MEMIDNLEIEKSKEEAQKDREMSFAVLLFLMLVGMFVFLVPNYFVNM